MNKVLIGTLFIASSFTCAASFADGFAQIPNAAISGYNNRHLTAVTVDDCKAACINETSFDCKSFDFYKSSNKCDLSIASAVDVGGLKYTYSGNPYDHYARVSLPPATPSFSEQVVERDVLGDNTNSGFTIDTDGYALEWLDFDAARDLSLSELDALLASGWRFATTPEIGELFSLVVASLTTYQSGNQYYCDDNTAPCEAGWNHVFATVYTNGSVGYYPPSYPNGLAQYFVYDNQPAGYTGAFSFSDTVWDGYASKNDTSYPTYQYYNSPYEFVKSQMNTYGENNNRFATLVRAITPNSCTQ